MSKKLIIAFSALALAILAGAIAVVGVFAAQQQKVANTFTITYTANNVSCIGWAEYDQNGASGSLGEIYISPTDGEKDFTMISKDFTLTAADPWVIIFVGLKNENSAGGKSMTVTLTDNSATKTNVEILYAVKTGENGFPFPPIVYNNMVGLDGAEKLGSETVPETITLAPQAGCIYSICIGIKDNTLDAEYISTADAGLGFTLNAV